MELKKNSRDGLFRGLVVLSFFNFYSVKTVLSIDSVEHVLLSAKISY